MIRKPDESRATGPARECWPKAAHSSAHICFQQYMLAMLVDAKVKAQVLKVPRAEKWEMTEGPQYE
jgi:hypothetical protein